MLINIKGINITEHEKKLTKYVGKVITLQCGSKVIDSVRVLSINKNRHHVVMFFPIVGKREFRSCELYPMGEFTLELK